MADGLAPVLTALTALGGAVGWVWTVRANRAASRDQHTFDSLLQLNFDPLFQMHLNAVRPYIYGTGFPDLTIPGNDELKKSLNFLLNCYEFLAVGLRNGGLSEELI